MSVNGKFNSFKEEDMRNSENNGDDMNSNENDDKNADNYYEKINCNIIENKNNDEHNILHVLRRELINHYKPEIFDLVDNTDRHVGHGNNGLHLSLKIKSDLLCKNDLLSAHRSIYDFLGDRYMSLIHAISIEIL